VLHADFAACDGYDRGFESAAQVKCPALFLLGGRDAMTPAARDWISPGRFRIRPWVTLDFAGHNLMAKADEFLDALVEFLRA